MEADRINATFDVAGVVYKPVVLSQNPEGFTTEIKLVIGFPGYGGTVWK
jgi:hypothetical protein